jgi:hypothetical protein
MTSSPGPRRSSRGLAGALRNTSSLSWLGAAALVAGCTAGELGSFDQPPVEEPPAEPEPAALTGDNLGGLNLGGSNLGGANLGGANLGGVNLGGVNLGGSNLGGVNLGGSNLGGNNLGGNNLAATNLGGSNLGGVNLGGVNLGGSNLGGSNLGGSNLGGSNLAGNNLGGSNLGGSNLGGSNTGRNIHNLTGSINGLLYSAEDMWTPKTGQCVVMGLGSTAFPKLLGQQSASAKISVALGKLPWGFASSAGGPIKLQAWEAIVWGDKTYCVFVMGAPAGSTWAGVAGFIKAVFRWNAPTTQMMEISGIEASAPHDSTLRTDILSYAGMMNAAARFRAGTITEKAFIAGELAFVSATTNNQSVLVDFSTWVQDKDKNALVLGQVTSVNPPTYAEALYIALENPDGTVTIMLDDAASRAKVMPTGMTNSVVDLNTAYLAWQAGLGPKPVPRRCGGALYLKTWFGEPVPPGKCDDGLAWAPGFCVKHADPWSRIAGTTAPMNSYMTVTKGGANSYQRGLIAGESCGPMRNVLSETYVHMWERNFDIPPGACTAESNASFCARRGKNCGAVTGTDNCGSTRTVSSCGSCASPQSCGGSGVSNVCGSSNSTIYEAEALGNSLSGQVYVHACPEAYIKVLGSVDPAVTAGACAGGARLRYVGGSSSNYITFNNVNVPSAGTYALTIYAGTRDVRTFNISINGGTAVSVNMDGVDFGTMVSVTKTVTLKAGNNTLKFYNNSASTPDLDRIKVTLTGGSSCTAESNAEFCARQARTCGSLSGTDNCGVARTVSSCGSCASPQTCGGGGEPNVCGGGASGTCGSAYGQGNCLTYTTGTVVASGGRNWTCANGNCRNCATFTGCAPGGTDCPYGLVWADSGACSGGTGGGGGGTGTCSPAFAKSSCLTYTTGTKVSKSGRNWTCANGNCANCAGHTTCEPGASGCPWGVVWTDNGTCN